MVQQRPHPTLFDKLSSLPSPSAAAKIPDSDQADSKGKIPERIPLAERLRPQKLEEIVGHKDLLDKNSSFMRMVTSNQLSSFILWGPPGVGKTTVARLLAYQPGYSFKAISALFTGVGDLKKIFEEAQILLRMGSQKMILFVDEIHRFNRTQQDAFLPLVENGTFVLVGATTQNPSFELNGALLSRLQVFTLGYLDRDALRTLVDKASQHMGKKLPLLPEALEFLIEQSQGDGRYLISQLESLYLLPDQEQLLSRKDLALRLQKKAALYDKSQDQHYNLISALHKSIRGSNVDAALYWLMRMVEGGQDLKYIGRRLIRMALEDVGLADKQALWVTLKALEAYERLGSPEGDLAFSHAVIYLAMAPKSNGAYKAHGLAQQCAQKTSHLPPPLSILNAPTSLMAELGYGQGYIYDHDVDQGVSGQNFWPDAMDPEGFYHPKTVGEEEFYIKQKKAFEAMVTKAALSAKKEAL